MKYFESTYARRKLPLQEELRTSCPDAQSTEDKLSRYCFDGSLSRRTRLKKPGEEEEASNRIHIDQIKTT